MSILIEGFKKEHSEIIKEFKKVEQLDVLTKEGHAKLMSIVAYLLNHLWDEDEKLYPVLRKAAVHNMKLKEILTFFVNGLGDIHEKMLKFFTKYYREIKDSNFQKEYENLYDELSKRIEYEENILFDVYEKLNKP